jgi:hypothetical protein
MSAKLRSISPKEAAELCEALKVIGIDAEATVDAEAELVRVRARDHETLFRLRKPRKQWWERTDLTPEQQVLRLLRSSSPKKRSGSKASSDDRIN